MEVFVVTSTLNGQDEIEGVFSTEAIAETYVETCSQDPVYDGCTFIIQPEVVDAFIN